MFFMSLYLYEPLHVTLNVLFKKLLLLIYIYIYYRWGLIVVFQLLRSSKRHKENKRKIGQEHSSMQANYQCHRPTPWMQERVPMHKCPSYTTHAVVHESGKTRGRETGKTEARRLMKRKAVQQNKNTLEELKQVLPRHS